NAGLGYEMLQAQGQLETPRVFAAVLLVTWIAVVLFVLVTVVERLTIPWARAGTLAGGAIAAWRAAGGNLGGRRPGGWSLAGAKAAAPRGARGDGGDRAGGGEPRRDDRWRRGVDGDGRARLVPEPGSRRALLRQGQGVLRAAGRRRVDEDPVGSLRGPEA